MSSHMRANLRNLRLSLLIFQKRLSPVLGELVDIMYIYFLLENLRKGFFLLFLPFLHVHTQDIFLCFRHRVPSLFNLTFWLAIKAPFGWQMEGQFISPEGAWPQAIGYLLLFLVKFWNESWMRHGIFLNNSTDFHNSFNISVSKINKKK